MGSCRDTDIDPKNRSEKKKKKTFSGLSAKFNWYDE